jgi:hypothetical protein
MINLERSISTIEQLLEQHSDASLTYAALECRLALERICYERLRIVHDYISHDDIKKWNPKHIVNIIRQEVNPTTTKTFTLSISKEPLAEGAAQPDADGYEKTDFIAVGTQVGFNPTLIGKLWNALANLALHIRIPTSKDDDIPLYGDQQAIKAKVEETLLEMKRIASGTLISSGIGQEISWECSCGMKNKRRYALLQDNQTINCINSKCNESYDYIQSDNAFLRRTFEITCRKCDQPHNLATRVVEVLRKDQPIQFDCENCRDKIYLCWRLMQTQQTQQVG